MSSPAPEARARVAALYGDALAALARDDLDAASAAIEQVDALVPSLAGSPLPGQGQELAALHARLTESARTMRDAVAEQRRQIAVAERTIRGYAESLEDRRPKLDAEA